MSNTLRKKCMKVYWYRESRFDKHLKKKKKLTVLMKIAAEIG